MGMGSESFRALLLLFAVANVALLVATVAATPSKSTKALHTPAYHLSSAPFAEWAVGHWVWLSSSAANQSSEIAFVNQFLANGIAVSAVDLDSQWATGDNNFVFDTSKYPNASAMIETFHSQGINVICWVTSMIDTDSSNFAEGLAAGFYLNKGKTLKWWHGEGAFLDYTNPAAVDWWHAQMDAVLDIGVDGWKTDGTDPYVLEFGLIEAHSGLITYRDYADAYYGDFFNYTRQVRGFEGLIMSRPVDDLWTFSPRSVVFSGWVGDDDPTFDGMKSALWSMFHSAYRGFVGFGSDIGGYRCCGPDGVIDPPLGRTVEVFTRWAQMGAFCSLMENGGDNEHGPWAFGPATLATYRLFVAIHLELTPYLVSAGTTAWETGVSIMKPLAVDVPQYPERWDYLLWNDLFVFPVVENVTSVDIRFPDGADWVDWWDNTLYTGGSKVTGYAAPLSILPVFHRQGSILPLRVVSGLAGHGDETQRNALTLLIVRPRPSSRPHSIDVHYSPSRAAGLGRTIHYQMSNETRLRVWGSGHPERVFVLVRGLAECPAAVTFALRDGVLSVSRGASSSDFVHDASFGFHCRTRSEFNEAPLEMTVAFSAEQSLDGFDAVTE